MTDHKHATPSSPGHDRLDDVIEGATDEATEDMLVEVVSAIWRGFDSPTDIDALIERRATDGFLFDIDRVSAVAAETFSKKRSTEAGWPQTTDCDRLDRVFARLHVLGICALQCTGDSLRDGVRCVGEALDASGVAQDRYKGFCFFHTQDIDRALDDEGLFLAFGPIDSDSVEDEDEIAIGQTICEALREAGLEPDWNGSGAVRIGLPRFCWQRRTPA